ncbi:response regulator transcription factor [Herbaspirillum sp. WKF16]|uniref:response regulator n=1 Tax=Herbaspirillum sp. WKF16 TaxID=3028312 RepID=UPI0023A9BB15|nr:response regulator transcription factor [Herbaspirillum sp. WKF16]WDZ96670.1 response regulator transcription factor [Herbaspirillum sp. WKF16]
MHQPLQPLPPGAQPDTASDVAIGAIPRQIHLALIDDDAEFRGAVIAAVQHSNDTRLVAIAASGAEGALLLQQAPADVLLVGASLPYGAGLTLIRQAARRWPGCAIMAGTTLGDRADLLACIEAGAAGYLSKDSSPLQMLEEIRSVGSGGGSINPLIAHRLLVRARRGEPVLSSYEAQALELIAHGFTAGEAARRMQVTRHAVLACVRRIYARLERAAGRQIT